MSATLEPETSARLQVLYLPAITEDGVTRQPYALVLDNISAEQTATLNESGLHEFARSVGATSMLVFSFPVDVT